MIDNVDRATLPGDAREGACTLCGRPARAEPGHWPVHVETGAQCCAPAVHLHGPVSGPVCGADQPDDRKRESTAYRSDTTCLACLATLSH